METIDVLGIKFKKTSVIEENQTLAFAFSIILVFIDRVDRCVRWILPNAGET